MRKMKLTIVLAAMALLYGCGGAGSFERVSTPQTMIRALTGETDENENTGLPLPLTEDVSGSGEALPAEGGGTVSAGLSGGSVSTPVSAESTAAKSSAESNPEDQASRQSTEGQLCVYICGAVKTPGVYYLHAGARLYEAVDMAGGLLEEADERCLNQASLLADGQQITVPTREEASGGGFSFSQADMTGGGADPRVNINTADAEALMTLSGVGEAKARAIIEYRETYGAFRRAEDIMLVSGIKEALYYKIRDQITVS